MKNTKGQFQNLLAIESATSLCSVALRSGKVVCQMSTNAIGKHSSAIFTQAQELLSSRGLSISDLDGVLIGAGPGSYTGLRVAASAVKGMLFGQDVPLFGVNTLAGFAAGINGISGEHNIHVIIDARRTHVYTQSFRVGMAGRNDVQHISTGSKSVFETIAEPASNTGLKSELNAVDKSGSVQGVNSGDFKTDHFILQSITALNDPSLTEIDDIYDRFQVGDFLIGTGILRLNPSKTTGLQVREIDKTGAIGLIRIFDAGLDQFYKRIDVTDFEPTYSVPEN